MFEANLALVGHNFTEVRPRLIVSEHFKNNCEHESQIQHGRELTVIMAAATPSWSYSAARHTPGLLRPPH